jgi:hypothetical protein
LTIVDRFGAQIELIPHLFGATNRTSSRHSWRHLRRLGIGPAGGEAVVIGVLDAGVAAQLPSEIGGLPVVVNVTGEVNALDQR